MPKFWLTFVTNTFYSVVLFAAAGETSGLLQGACFFAAALSVLSTFLLIVGYSLLATIKDRK